MAVPSNHVYVKGGDEIVAALGRVVDYAEAVVSESAQTAIMEHHQRMQAQAQQDDQWRSMASDLQYWTDADGSLAYGIPREHPSYDQAVRTEYGDTTQAPTPLIRMGLVNGVSQIGWSMQQAFFEAGFH